MTPRRNALVTVLTAVWCALLVPAAAQAMVASAGPPQPPLPRLPAHAGSAPGHAPVPGVWRVSKHIVASVGFNHRADPWRTWRVTRHCGSGRCRYRLIEHTPGRPTHTTTLRATRRGWVGSPTILVPCSQRTRWRLRVRMLLRFSANRRSLRVAESVRAFTPHCGYGLAQETWTGHRVRG